MAGTATKTTGVVLIPKTDPGAATVPGASLLCNFCSCAYTEYVFADASTDAWKNDTTSFLFRKYAPADTVALELWKAGAKVVDITDSSYGSYYPFGVLVQPDYLGWRADWKLISDSFGFGTYTVKAAQNLQGIASVIESRRFRCSPYADDLADGTVRLEWWQSGNIIGSAFDYTDLDILGGGWKFSVRLPGRFGQKTPILESDSYTDSSYRRTQIQDTVQTDYVFESYPIPQEIADTINYNAVLGNRIAITDYSVNGPIPYQPIEVAVSGIETKNRAAKETAYVFTMRARTTSAIKRNF